jgi:hypothetical protein
MHESLGGLAFMGPEMMRICFLERVGDEAAFHAFVSAIRRGFSVRATAKPHVFALLHDSLGVVLAVGFCIGSC